MTNNDLALKVRTLLAHKNNIRAEEVDAGEIEKYILLLQNKTLPKTAQFITKCFEQISAKTPHKNAIIFSDKQQITYHALNQRANLLAEKILSYSSNQHPIAICIAFNINLVVALLGILKSGCSFVLLSPEESSNYQRIAQETLGMEGIITSHSDTTPIDHYKWVITLDDNDCETSIKNPVPNIRLNNTAGLLPSGDRWVEISYASLWTRVEQLQKAFSLAESDTVYLSHYLGKNAFIIDTLWTLLQGATVFIPAGDFSENAHCNKFTDIDITLAHLDIEDLVYFSKNASFPSGLNQIICNGTVLKNTLVQEVLKHTNANFAYFYSQPETGMLSKPYFCTLTNNYEFIPLGYGDKKHHLLLNKNMQAVPDGTVGDLFFYGESLANQYSHISAANEHSKFLHHYIDSM